MNASRYSMALILMVAALVASTLVQPVVSPIKADAPDGHHEIWVMGSDEEEEEKITNFGADTRHPSLPILPPGPEQPPPIMAVVSNCSDNVCTCIGDDNEIFILYLGEDGPLLWQLTDNDADDRDPSLALWPFDEGFLGILVYASNCSDNVCSSTADYELFLLAFAEIEPGELQELYGPIQLTDNDADDIEPSLSFFPEGFDGEGFSNFVVAFSSTCSDNVCSSAGADYEIYGGVIEIDESSVSLYPEWQFTDNDADDRHPSLWLWETDNEPVDLVATIAYSSTCSDNVCSSTDEYFDIYLTNALIDEPPELEIAGNWNIIDFGEDIEADFLEPSLVMPFGCQGFPNAVLSFTVRCHDVDGCDDIDFGESAIVGAGIDMDNEDPYEEPDTFFGGFFNIGSDDIESSLLFYEDQFECGLEGAFASDFRYFSANCTASPNPTKVGHEVEFECVIESVSDNTICAEEYWHFEYYFFFGDGDYDYTTGDEGYSDHTYSEAGTYCPKVTVEWWCGDPDEDGEIIATETFFFDPLVVNPPLSVSCNATPNPTEVGVPVSLSANITGGVPPYTCLWSSAYGNVNSCNATYTFPPEAGNNDPSMSLTVTDSLSNEATCSIEFWVYEALEVTCDAEPVLVQRGTPVSFNCTASGGYGDYNCSWDFGDSSPTSDNCVTTHAYASAGMYTATVTVTDNLTAKTCSENITVYDPLEVACGASPNPTKAGHEVQFTSTPSGGYGSYSYAWDFGDSSPTSDNQSPLYTYQHDYNEPQTYIAMITVTDNLTNTASCNVTMTVNPRLAVVCDATPNPTKSGHEVQFSSTPSGGVPGYTYVWDFGDGIGTSQEQNPSYTYIHDESEPQTYIAVVTVTDNLTNVVSCNTTMTVNPGLGVRCGAAAAMAIIGREVDFSCIAMGGVSPYTYQWDFGDGASSTEQNPKHAYSFPGNYTATVTVTDSLGNVVSCSTSVTVTTVGGRAGPGVSPPGTQPQLNPFHIELQYLRVTPQQTTAGQPVTITTNVVNTGYEAGSYNVALKINGRVEQTKMVSVGAQGTQPVKFTTTKAQPGTYTVDIGYQKASFVVAGAVSSHNGQMSGGVLFVATVAVIAILVVLLLIVARRRFQGY
ncbi:MAG: PKD domain-containing protein [Chloroflexota bacterium]|nr:MAG: PKD domain-containing protein [Chloroflexota bacterium]